VLKAEHKKRKENQTVSRATKASILARPIHWYRVSTSRDNRIGFQRRKGMQLPSVRAF